MVSFQGLPKCHPTQSNFLVRFCNLVSSTTGPYAQLYTHCFNIALSMHGFVNNSFLCTIVHTLFQYGIVHAWFRQQQCPMYNCTHTVSIWHCNLLLAMVLSQYTVVIKNNIKIIVKVVKHTLQCHDHRAI